MVHPMKYSRSFFFFLWDGHIVVYNSAPLAKTMTWMHGSIFTDFEFLCIDIINEWYGKITEQLEAIVGAVSLN